MKLHPHHRPFRLGIRRGLIAFWPGNGYFHPMSAVQLEKAVTELSQEEFRKFRAWFANYDMAQWDKQIERDSAAGKLDRLMEEAMEDYRAGRTTEI